MSCHVLDPDFTALWALRRGCLKHTALPPNSNLSQLLVLVDREVTPL